MKFEQDAMLAEAGAEDEFIKCFDDITGKELPWQAVKEAREKELKHLRELGLCEKRLMRAQQWQIKTSRQSTQSGSTLGADANPFTNCCQRAQTWKQARLVC